jgi:mono/diheme cytochrome c family protein
MSSSKHRLLRAEEKNMWRKLLPAAVITVSALAPLATYAEQKLSLKSVSVELPFGDRMFPDGSGADLVNGNCLACHSVGMVLYQPALSEAQWRTEVEKMRTAYKAPIDPKDVDKIIDYLYGLGRR